MYHTVWPHVRQLAAKILALCIVPSAHETDTGHGYVAASSMLGDFRFSYEVEVTGVVAEGPRDGGLLYGHFNVYEVGGRASGRGVEGVREGGGEGRGWGRGRGAGVRF